MGEELDVLARQAKVIAERLRMDADNKAAWLHAQAGGRDDFTVRDANADNLADLAELVAMFIGLNPPAPSSGERVK